MIPMHFVVVIVVVMISSASIITHVIATIIITIALDQCTASVLRACCLPAHASRRQPPFRAQQPCENGAPPLQSGREEAEGAHRRAEAGNQGGLRPLRHRRQWLYRLQGAEGGDA